MKKIEAVIRLSRFLTLFLQKILENDNITSTH